MRIWGDRNDRQGTTPPVTSATAAATHDHEERRAYWERLESRWRIEDDRWERHTLNTELAQALDRMGDATNPVMRICGARILADIAIRIAPHPPNALMSQQYPFFGPAAHCLAAAVQLEEHPAVRYEIRAALTSLTDFARSGGQRLLPVLIHSLADANRAACRAFVDTLGRYLAKYGAENQSLPPLLGFLPFSQSKEATLHCLQTLAQEPECETLRDRQAALRVAQGTYGEPSVAANNSLIDTLAVRGARLIDARDALAGALHALQGPPPDTQASARAFQEWQDSRRLHLYNVFLVGAQLNGVQLAGCYLTGAYLTGAYLEGANLLAADLVKTDLYGAELYNAVFDDRQRPQLRANLRDANWWDASPTSWRGNNGQAAYAFLNANFPPAAVSEPGAEEEDVKLLDLDNEENSNGLTDEMVARIHGTPLPSVPSASAPVAATPSLALSEAEPSVLQVATPTAPPEGAKAPAAVEPSAQASEPASPIPASIPTSTPPAKQTAADKIAELKRRAAERGAWASRVATTPPPPPVHPAAVTPASPPVASTPAPAAPSVGKSARRSSAKDGLLAAANSVSMRESGLPKSNERVSSKDLMEVADLMTGATPVTNASVQIRESGRPQNAHVTSDDLLEITDLMSDQ